MVPEAIIRYVYVREDEAALVYLNAHLLAEGTTHKKAIVIATSATLVGECREVQVLEGISIDAFVVRQQLF